MHGPTGAQSHVRTPWSDGQPIAYRQPQKLPCSTSLPLCCTRRKLPLLTLRRSTSRLPTSFDVHGLPMRRHPARNFEDRSARPRIVRQWPRGSPGLDFLHGRLAPTNSRALGTAPEQTMAPEPRALPSTAATWPCGKLRLTLKRGRQRSSPPRRRAAAASGPRSLHPAGTTDWPGCACEPWRPRDRTHAAAGWAVSSDWPQLGCT